MITRISRRFALVAALVFAARAGAQTQPAAEPTSPKELGAMIAPFVDDYSMGVIHVDVTRVNTDAIEKSVNSVLDGAKVPADDMIRQGISQGRLIADGFLARVKTIGVKDAFLTFDYVEHQWGPPVQAPTFIFPMESAAKAEQLQKFFQATFGPGATVVIANEKVVIIPTMLSEADIRGIKPSPRPEFENGFAATKGSIQLVAAFSPNVRDAISAKGKLAPEVGGGKFDEAITGAEYLSVAATLPPEISLSAKLHADNAEHAEKLKDFFVKCLDLGHTEIAKEKARMQPQWRARQEAAMNMADEMLTLLVPKVEGADLVLSYDQKRIEAFFTEKFMPMINAELHRSSMPAPVKMAPVETQP